MSKRFAVQASCFGKQIYAGIVNKKQTEFIEKEDVTSLVLNSVADWVDRSYDGSAWVELDDWSAHGKAAGPIRNQKMVDLGAAVCLAFPTPDSRGTWDCVRRAKAAGIPVHVYEAR